MTPPVVPGMRVVHPRKGPGTVLEALPRGRARVRFDRLRLLPRVVSVTELSPQSPSPAPPSPKKEKPPPALPSSPAGRAGKPREEVSPKATPASTPRGQAKKQKVPPAITGKAASYRQTLEALRLGVVPRDHVLDYTVGREKELAALSSFLSRERGLRLVWGDYGSGKTHLLDILEGLALKEGFLTSRIVLDPQEIPPSHPKRLFKAFLRSLRYPGQVATGWTPLFSRLTSSRDHLEPDGPYFSRYLSPVLFALASGDKEAREWASDYIEGYPMDTLDFLYVLKKAGWRGPRTLSLPDYRTFGRVYTHILGALATWASTAGFKGLLLLLDEMEYVDSLDLTHRRLTWEVLGHFAAATLPRKRLAFDPADLYKGGNEVHRRFPIRFKEDQPLSVVLAFTPLEEISLLVSAILRDPSRNSIYLESLGKESHLRLIKNVIEIYRRGYPGYSPSRREIREMAHSISKVLDQEEVSPREIVRTVVLALDARRLGKPLFPEENGPGREDALWE